MDLRYYQGGAIAATWNYLEHQRDNPCIVLPTGSGKSPTMAEMARQAVTNWPGSRVCILAHKKELVEQNADKLFQHWPEGRDKIGIYQAAMRRRDTLNPIIYAGIQSVYSKAMQLGAFDLVMVDEAHRIPIKGDGQYREFLDGAKRANRAVRTVGFTATPYRMSGGPICQPDYILNSICYEAHVADLIREGYLSRLVSKAGIAKPDVSRVPLNAEGDYTTGAAMTAAVDEVVEDACDEIVAYCKDRKAWIVFAANEEHARHVTDALTRRGIKTACVTNKTPNGEREKAVRDIKSGAIRCVVNINIFSEGFDAPNIDAVILMRPTLSAGLYYQQVGRGFRLFAGKLDCLVLDFAGNIAQHGPVDAIIAPKRPGQKATSSAPQKQCPKCHEMIAIQCRTCPDPCGYVFPIMADPGAKHDTTASGLGILSDEIAPPQVFDVDNVTYHANPKKGKPTTLRVTYRSGLRFFHEWVTLEHSGENRVRALTWWMKHDPAGLTPHRVEHALTVTDRLRKPVQILVRDHPKLPEVLDHAFDN